MSYKKKPDEWKYAIKVLSTSPEIFQLPEEVKALLKEIEVTRCLKLKKLPLDPSRAMGGKIVIKGKEDRQDELQLY
ncbi:hypothetical protein CUMW_261520 [Citrus unshiu]|uniref:Uncharacterized protein n=1 Tax=Citrus unshiu TaxID=55188 RepID=A0A2H5QU05_CITUN|nr:hypothetical protein CUMW_261520 [Citrus unshiu]